MDFVLEDVARLSRTRAFRPVIDLLIDAGLLAARHTIDEVRDALALYLRRSEILEEFESFANDGDLEAYKYQRYILRREGKRAWVQEWRSKPENADKVRAQRQRERQRARKQARARDREKRAAWLRQLEEQRRAAKAQRRARISGAPAREAA